MMKKLDERYKNVCNNILDARDYTVQNLSSNIEINIDEFYKSLEEINIEQCEDYLHKMEETILQCKVAVKNEKARRTLLIEIQKKTQKEHNKKKEKEEFKLERRVTRLRQATPYPSRQHAMTDSQ